MNDEIGNFFIKFTTEGFDKVEKQLKELNKNVEDLGDSFDKGTKSGESFFGALLKWDITVGTITKSFQALRDAVASVFDVAGEMTTLYKKEEDLGVEAKVLERWGIIARRFKGTQNDAYDFFGGIQDLMKKAKMPSFWSDEEGKMLALSHIGWTYDFNKNPVQNRDAFLRKLREAAVSFGDDADTRSILKKYIPQDSLYTFFGAKDEDFDSIMKWADELRVLSKDPEKLKDAQDLETVTIEWEQIWKEIKVEFIPVLKDVLVALKPLQEPMKDLAKSIGDWVSKNRDNLAKWVEDAAKWVANTLPTAWENFVKGMAKVGEIVSDIYDWMKKKGVVGKTWDSVKMVWDAAVTAAKVVGNAIVGDDEAVDKAINDFGAKYDKEGAGGYLGAGIRRTADKLVGTSSTSVTNNNGPSTLIINPGEITQRTVVDLSQPRGAMMASMMKGV